MYSALTLHAGQTGKLTVSVTGATFDSYRAALYVDGSAVSIPVRVTNSTDTTALELTIPAQQPGNYLLHLMADDLNLIYRTLEVLPSPLADAGGDEQLLIHAAVAGETVTLSVNVTSLLQGTPGLTAYELAVQNGYSGSEADWLAGVTEIAAMQTDAAASAAAAAESATKAAASESTLTTAASEATAAATAAASSESAAAASAAAAAESATSATTSATTATGAATEAGNSAAQAKTDAETASTKAGEAATSAETASSMYSKARGQAQASAASAKEAAASAESAATDAATATSKATEAGDSATAAAASATAAAADAATVASTASTFSEITERWQEISDLIPETTADRPVGAVADSRFAGWALERSGKVYVSRVFSAGYNPNPQITDAQLEALNVQRKLFDNANRVAGLATASTTPERDDYLTEFLFYWERCNYVRDKSGVPYITAVRGDSAYKTTGPVDVGVFGPTFWYKTAYDMREDHLDENGAPMYQLWIISELPFDQLSEAYQAELTSYGITSLDVWPESVRADGSIAPYWCHSAYYAGIASDGYLRSQPGLPLYCNQGASSSPAIFRKKGTGYQGSSSSVTAFGMLFDLIKWANKNSQSIHPGCTNFNYTYTPAVNTYAPATDDAEAVYNSGDWFPLTAAQAANIPLGSTVYIGTASGLDYTGTGRNIIKAARVIAKNTATVTDAVSGSEVSVVQVQLDIDGDQHFSVTTTAANADATNRVAYYLNSGQPISGDSDRVQGKYDGQYIKDYAHAYRVQGTELAVGAWLANTDVCIIRTNTAGTATINGEEVTLRAYDAVIYKRPLGVTYTTTQATIQSTWTPIGVLLQTGASSNSDAYIGDVEIHDGVAIPVLVGSAISGGNSSTAGHCDIQQYGSTGTWSGVWAWYTEGSLSYGGSAGSAAVYAVYPSNASWHYAPRD